MAPLVDNDTRRRLRQSRKVTLLGTDLASAKEEAFVLMVMDGLAIGAAYAKAGFNSKATNAPYILFHKPHIQARASTILEARRTQGVVTLPEVTSMLKRVFAGALHDAEYSAAHNAAFSLARIYGHVTDRATLEVIRRPSRDPDTPSEQALGDWVAGLAVVGASGPEPALEPPEGSRAPLRGAPATLLGDAGDPILIQPESQGELSNDIKGPGPEGPSQALGPGPLGLENPSDIKGLALGGSPVWGRPENGAPAPTVTGTPQSRARAGLLGPEPSGNEGTPHHGGGEKGAPLPDRQVPDIPSAEELFG